MRTTTLRLATFALFSLAIFAHSLYGADRPDQLATTGFAVQVVNSEQGTIDLRLQMETLQTNPVYVDGARYDRIAIEGATPAVLEGRPELPAVVRYVLIPPQSGVELEIGRVVMRIEKGLNPYPVQPEDPTNLLNPAVMNLTPRRDGGLFVDPTFDSIPAFGHPNRLYWALPVFCAVTVSSR